MRLRELFTTTLNELKMAPGSLKKMSSSIKGFCGIEFELFVPGIGTGEDPDNYEFDYSDDPVCYSISDIAEFYGNDEYGYNDDNLPEIIKEMRDNYHEYANEVMVEEFTNEIEDLVREKIIDNDWDEDEKFQEVYKELGYTDEEISACERWRNGKETDEDKNSWSGPQFSQAKTEVEEMLDEAVANSIRNVDRNYEDAREDWEQTAEWPDESDFLRSVGIRTMYDVMRVDFDYNLSWPHRIYGKGDGISITELAAEFEKAIGRRTFGCEKGYHGCEDQKGQDQYVIEKDGSLIPEEGFAGIEIVAPTLPLSEMVDEIKDVVKWAKEYGCYTDSHCGLHINISIENMDMEQLDYIKLALFIGDEYVLREFNRLSSTYAKSSIKQIKSRMEYSPNITFEVLSNLQQNLASIASKLIYAINNEKKVSLNARTNHLEVRSPGGDWLNEDISKLESMVHRFIVALDIACDPSKYKEEYAKKFYKLVNPGGDNKAADAFSRYNAGIINIETLQKELYSKSVHPRTSLGHKSKPYDNVWNVESLAGHEITVQADTAIAAVDVARKQLKLNSVQYPNHTFTVTPVVQGDMFSNVYPDKLSPPPTEQPLPKQPETPERIPVRDRIELARLANSQQNIF